MLSEMACIILNNKKLKPCKGYRRSEFYEILNRQELKISF